MPIKINDLSQKDRIFLLQKTHRYYARNRTPRGCMLIFLNS